MARIPETVHGALPGTEILVETGPQQQTLSPPLTLQITVNVLWLRWT